MNDDHNIPQLPPIQLLITACPKVADAKTRYAWLHGYCLISYSQIGDTVGLVGKLRMGQPYCDNGHFITGLADALDPEACLASLDLHDLVSCLSGLPIGARDQGPALALLGKLKTMLDGGAPIDLSLDDDHSASVAAKALQLASGFSGSLAQDEGAQAKGCTLSPADLDNGNPRRLAEDLVEAASIAILAIGDLYVSDELRPQLEAKWRAWRQSLAPSIPLPKPSLAVVSSN